jgi:hypothetical protein
MNKIIISKEDILNFLDFMKENERYEFNLIINVMKGKSIHYFFSMLTEEGEYFFAIYMSNSDYKNKRS